MTNRWCHTIFLLVALSTVCGRPSNGIYPVYRSLEPKDGSSADKTEKSLEDIAVVARSTHDSPSPSIAEQTKKVVEKIEEMIEKDVRTPPKLAEGLKEKEVKNESSTTVAPVVDGKIEANGRFQVSGTKPPAQGGFEGKASNSKKEEGVKGVAVPVIMEEELETPPKKLQKLPSVSKPKEEKKKLPATQKPLKDTPTTTPSSGLSTWILLSDNKDATTPTSVRKKTSTTTRKPGKVQSTTPTTLTSKPVKKVVERRPDQPSALETLVKQKTGSIITAQKKKEENKKVATIPPAILVETTEASELTTTEVTPEVTTKKKKTSTKRKKNKKKKKPAAEKSGDDQVINDLQKQPRQPVGAQFYNFLSREIMPTVGLGLVGVLVTAGLAGLLGYNPFQGANIPVRRTYESQHGYYPAANYYTYHSEFDDAPENGKNEEVLFGEVLSGMPEDSRYGVPASEVSYPESQLYSSQEMAYKAVKNPTKTSESEYSDRYESHYDSYTNKEQVGSKRPVYSGGSYVYPESSTEKFKASAKYDEKIEKQPEALYRVSSDYAAGSDGSEASGTDTDQSWHRIGSPKDRSSHLSYVEPGPRKLDLDKMTEQLTATHKRTRRSPDSIITRLVRRSNEIARNLNPEDEKLNEIDTGDEERPTEKMTEPPATESLTTTSESQPNLTDSFPTETPASEVHPSFIDVLRRLAQFKLRLGINFLKATTDALGKYLEGVQQRVEDSMASDTSFPAKKYAWLGRSEEDPSKIREKRYQR